MDVRPGPKPQGGGANCEPCVLTQLLKVKKSATAHATVTTLQVLLHAIFSLVCYVFTYRPTSNFTAYIGK